MFMDSVGQRFTCGDGLYALWCLRPQVEKAWRLEVTWLLWASIIWRWHSLHDWSWQLTRILACGLFIQSVYLYNMVGGVQEKISLYHSFLNWSSSQRPSMTKNGHTSWTQKCQKILEPGFKTATEDVEDKLKNSNIGPIQIPKEENEEEGRKEKR